jgi:hypothetical protein
MPRFRCGTVSSPAGDTVNPAYTYDLNGNMTSGVNIVFWLHNT